MEQKKTLWIALSTGIFLLIVFFAAMRLYYYPGMRESGSALALNGSDKLRLDSSMNKKSGSAISNLPDSKNPVSGTSSALSENSPSITSGLMAPQEGSSNLENGYTSSVSDAGVYTPANTTININSPVTTINLKDLKETDTSSSVTAKNETAAQELKETKAQKKIEEKTVTAKTETAKASTTPAKTSAAKTETAKAAPAKTASTNAAASAGAHYWVQVASYSSKSNADEAREVLDKKAMPCEVFTFTKDSRLYYRVRVGPYTTKSEADYWKKQVDSISMFKSSGSLVVDSSAKAK